MRRRAFRQHSSQKQSTSRNRCKTPVPRSISRVRRILFHRDCEVVAYLVREGYVDVLITTSGSLAEDVIKTAKPFKMGEWDSTKPPSGNRGINRLGNLFVPSDRYVWLEEYLYDFFEDFFADKRFGRRRRLLVNWETPRRSGFGPEASSGQ